MGAVSGLAYANGMLYVADSSRVAATPNNSRIMAFPTSRIPGVHDDLSNDNLTNTDCYLCGFNASFSLGQSTFIPAADANGNLLFSANRSQNGLANATGVATDGRYLAVADTDNNRVLLWNSVPTQMDQNADVVLGQTSFTSFKSPQSVDRFSLRGPQSVWIQNNHLFVADTQNHRVLIWNSWPTQNNQGADVVLGQNDFTHAYQPTVSDPPAPTSASQLLNPTSVTADASHLYVSDLGHNRVLIWNSIPNVNAQNADVIVGQPDMVQSKSNNPTSCAGFAIGPTNAQCPPSLNFPRYALPVNNKLFVADGGNDRVLIYSPIPTSNLPVPSGVLGEPDFYQDLGSSAAISIASTAVDNTGGVDLLQTPQALAWDGSNLYVSDPYNRRVLVYTPADTVLPASSVVNWASEIIRQEGIVQVTAPGTITANDTVTVTIAGTAYVYTIVKADTVDSIAQNLVKVINGLSGGTADPNVRAIFNGTGSGTLYLSSIASNLAFDTISLSVSESNAANELLSASGGYLSAGTAATGAIGMLVEINGTNLSDSTATATMNGTSSLPSSLGGTQVYMDGYACPILKTSPTQVVSQIPYGFLNRTSSSVYVRTVHNDGSVTATNAVAVYIAPANPGIFNAPLFAGEVRPWPIALATHQSGNATAVIDIEGVPVAGYTATIVVGGVSHTYVSTAADVSSGNLMSTVMGLVAAVNSNDTNVTASIGGAFNRVVLTAKSPEPGGNGISVTATTATSSTNTTVPGGFTLSAYSPATCCQVTPNSPIQIGNPAAPGELINVTAVGLGLVIDPTGRAQSSLGTGVPYSGPTNNTAQAFVTATMGITTAQVINAQLTAGSYGTYDVQMIVPTTAATNNATTLNIAQNAFISNTVTVPVGPAVTYTPAAPVAPVSPITESIEAPSAGASVSGTIVASGWALNSGDTLSGILISIDGQAQGQGIRYARADVCASYTSPDCPNPGPGWYLIIDTTKFADGAHTLTLSALSTGGTDRTTAQSFTIANGGTPAESSFHGLVEVPSANFTYHGNVVFSGWIADASASISGVSIYVDGTPEGAATLYSRPDVCAVYPGPNCQAGWYINLNTDMVANGAHTLVAKAISADGHTFVTSKTFQVQNFAGGSTSTLANIEAPSAGAAPFSGTMTVAGWAGDLNTTVSSIGITVDGVIYSNPVYGYSRSDVCSGVALQSCPGTGWAGTLDTTQLADGSHLLGIVVNLAGEPSVTFTRTFSVLNQGTSANPLMGLIDAPNNTTAVSGVTLASGWAINKGSTDPVTSVSVRVDGTSFGNATYGEARADVCAVTGSVAGCPNVGWSLPLNTALLGNGSHTIEITMTTAAGRRASTNTTFNVNNSTTGPGRVSIESPTSASSPFAGLAMFSGWALYDNGAISSLSATVDGVPYGVANYGTIARPDVCTLYPGRANCPNAGWNFGVDTTKLTDGVHSFGVTANNADGTYYTASMSFTVANEASKNPLQIQIDAPSTANNIVGTITISGWALSPTSTISNINLYVDGAPIGAATYGAARADVCLVYAGSPGCPNLGWYSIYNTALLTNGQHTLSVTAVTSTGQSSTISEQFNVVN